MKIRACRNSPFPPRDPLSRAWKDDRTSLAYDAMALESAIVSYVVGERSSDGVSVPQLTVDLLADDGAGLRNRRAIEEAVQRLVDGRFLRMSGATVLPGPVFGSATTTDAAPGSN